MLAGGSGGRLADHGLAGSGREIPLHRQVRGHDRAHLFFEQRVAAAEALDGGASWSGGRSRTWSRIASRRLQPGVQRVNVDAGGRAGHGPAFLPASGTAPRAFLQSRFTVLGSIWSTSAVSSTESPKKRSSTTCASRPSSVASFRSASSSASSAAPSPPTRWSRRRGRRAGRRRRASAPHALARGPRRSVASRARRPRRSAADPAAEKPKRRAAWRYASWTSAVVLSVSPGRLPRSARCATPRRS